MSESFERTLDKVGKDKKRIIDRFKSKDTVWEYLGPILSGKVLRDFGIVNRDN